MDDPTKPTAADLKRHATDIVAAYVTRNLVNPAHLPELIKTVHAALAALGAAQPGGEQPKPKPQPAVPPRRSLRPDRVVCLHCGQEAQMLKRHLWTAHRQTPDEYRRLWNLPGDYPLVAPAYSAARSQLAKANGLGTHAHRRHSRKGEHG